LRKKAGMKATVAVLSRLPPLQNRITKAANAKTMQKIGYLKTKLGDRYAEIGRDKRFSPTTLKRSSTSLSQRPIIDPEFKLKDYLVDVNNPSPLPIVPGDITETLKNRSLAKTEEIKKQNVKTGIRMEQKISQETVERNLSMQGEVVPKIVKKNGTFDAVTTTSSQGPYYAYNLEPEDVDFVLKKAPLASAIKSKVGINSDENSRAECIRRIISLDNGNGILFKKFNRQRIVELLGNEPFDTGSSQVQAGMFTLRIEKYKEHLKNNPKDNAMRRHLELFNSKRVKILRHLRRRVCLTFLIYRIYNCLSKLVIF
jgi:ribosomal protein S15